MLPEQGPEFPVVDSHAWVTRRFRVFDWRDLRHGLHFAFRKWMSIPMQNATPESPLAQMIVEIGISVDRNRSDDPMLLQRLEAQLAATDSIAVRNVLAAYLAEP